MFQKTPTFMLNGNAIEQVNSMDVLGVTYDRDLKYQNHVLDRSSVCGKSYSGLSKSRVCYPGLPSDVKSFLWKSICVPNLTYGFECINVSKVMIRNLETTQGLLVKQYMVLYKSCHSGPLLKPLNIDRICDVINNKVLGLFNQIFTICNSPVYQLNCFFFLARFLSHDVIPKGTLLSKIIYLKVSPIKAALNKIKFVSEKRADGLTDSIRNIAFAEQYTNPFSMEHNLLNLLLRFFNVNFLTILHKSICCIWFYSGFYYLNLHFVFCT